MADLNGCHDVRSNRECVRRLNGNADRRYLANANAARRSSIALFSFRTFLVLELLRALVIVVSDGNGVALNLFLSSSVFVRVFLSLREL